MKALDEAQFAVNRATAALHFEQRRVSKATAALMAATQGEAEAETKLVEAQAALDAARKAAAS